jgi:hypothetical protein
MHHKDYELAENCLQELREGRSKELTAAHVQAIAGRMIAATDTVSPDNRTAVELAREDAANAASALAMEMSSRSDSVDAEWEIAIDLADRWFEANK